MVSMIDDLAGFFQRALTSRVRIDSPHKKQTEDFEKLLSPADNSSGAGRKAGAYSAEAPLNFAGGRDLHDNERSGNGEYTSFAPWKPALVSMEPEQFIPRSSANTIYVTDAEPLGPAESAYLPSTELERRLWGLFGDDSEDGRESAAQISVQASDHTGVHSGVPTRPAVARAGQVPIARQFGKISEEKIDYADANGLIADIGKFLLDPHAVEALEELIRSEQPAKSVTKIGLAQDSALQRLQEYLLNTPDVIGTIVIGHDGSVMSSKWKNDTAFNVTDRSSLASWALSAYLNSRIATELIGARQPDHIVLTGEQGTSIISDFGKALLYTVTSAREATTVSALLEKLRALLS